MHSTWNRKSSAAILPAAALLVMTAACGGTTGSQGVNANGVQGVQNKVITIGSNAVLSGPASAYATISSATAHYFDYINSKGGVNGYTFKYIERDNAYSGAQAVTVARELALTDKVFAMVTAGSPPDRAVIALAPQLKLPIIALNDGDLFPGSVLPNLYGIEPRFSQITKGDARFLMDKLHIKKIAYIYENDDFGQPGSKSVPEYVKAHGGQFVANVGFPAGEANFNPYANQLKASGAEAVLIGAGPPFVAGIQKAAAAIGYHPVWMSMFSAVTPAYFELAGGQAEGTYMDDFIESLPNMMGPDMQTFREVLSKYPNEIGLLGALGWGSGALVARGVQDATAGGKALTWESFQTALNNLTGKRVALWPDVTWNAKSHSGATSEFIVQAKNGKFETVSGSEPLP